MKRTAVRLVAGSIMTMGLALGVAQGAGAQSQEPTGTELIVHQRLCGDNYQGGDPFTECHDYIVGDAYEFTIEGPVDLTGMTDAATGDLTFGGLTAGTYHLYGGIPGEFVTKEFYCSDQNTGDAVSVTDGAIGVNVEVPDGASVVCDVYEYPEDLSGNTPTPEPTAQPAKTPTTSTVTSLPSTGSGLDRSDDSVLLLAIPAAMAAFGGLGLAARRRALR